MCQDVVHQILPSLREFKWEESGKIDCHHKDSNKGHSLMASYALPLSYGVVVVVLHHSSR